ncbi:hypothetical protein Mapa_016989 [Marchantia paleacea]|nr:hypothetical protein Mapa_016989 [Marchantia paleacea]
MSARTSEQTGISPNAKPVKWASCIQSVQFMGMMSMISAANSRPGQRKPSGPERMNPRSCNAIHGRTIVVLHIVDI